MTTKSITTNIEEGILKQITSTFETVYQGAQISLESFFILRRFIQKELKGKFSENELKAIVDMFNATMFEPKLAQKTVLIAEIEDSEQYAGTLKRWDVNQDELIQKVKALSETQAFFMIFEAWNFWYSANKRSLDEFIKNFI